MKDYLLFDPNHFGQCAVAEPCWSSEAYSSDSIDDSWSREQKEHAEMLLKLEVVEKLHRLNGSTELSIERKERELQEHERLYG